MASRVLDAAFLSAAVIALIAFGLLILLTRPEAQSAGTSASPAASISQLPSISFTVAPATTAPTAAPTTAAPATTAPTTAAPTTAAPTVTPTPRLTTPPSASP
jgi:hypothetical protein